MCSAWPGISLLGFGWLGTVLVGIQSFTKLKYSKVQEGPLGHRLRFLGGGGFYVGLPLKVLVVE